MIYIFSANFNDLIYFAETICEGIRVFQKIVLIQSKSSPFLYELDYFDHFEKDLPLSYIKSIQFEKFSY